MFLINFSFDKGIFPKELAQAKVLPLHKEGSKPDRNNYRSISLLVVFSKEQCTIACTNILRNSLFYKKQFRFRSKHSIIDTLVEPTETVLMRQ